MLTGNRRDVGLLWMVEAVSYTSPTGHVFKTSISYAIGMNKWVVDPEIQWRCPNDATFSSETRSYSSAIYGNSSKTKAIDKAMDMLIESSQWFS